MDINKSDVMLKAQDEGYASVFTSPVKKYSLFPTTETTFGFIATAVEFISPQRLAERLNFQLQKIQEDFITNNNHHKNQQILAEENSEQKKGKPTIDAVTNNNVFILDCRSPFEFKHSHIKSSINIVVPSILYKRLIKGTLSTPSLISTDNIRETFGRAYKTSLIVLIQETSPPTPMTNSDQDHVMTTGYGNHVTNNNTNHHHAFYANQNNCTNGDDSSSISPLLYKKLREEGCEPRFIHGGLNAFYSLYPDLCQTSSLSTSSFSTVPFSFDNHHHNNRASSTIDIDNSSAASTIQTLTSSQSHVTSSLANRRNFSAERPSSLYYLDMKSLKLDDCGSSSDDSASTSGYSASSCATSCSGDSCYVGGACPEDPLLSSTNPISSGFNGSGVNDVFRNDEMGGITQCNQYQQNHRQDAKFPVEIIPHLFLGNSTNSTDREILRKYNIKYILNVTPDLPNMFEKDEFFHYLQIPIYDHWSQDLMVHFPAAINFIDEARQQHYGVLVHCLAGISRSVTVTVAYLMRTLSLCLEDAYDLVKNHKPNIAPNLNFMGQLLDFQRDLYGDDPPAANHVSVLRTPSSNAAGHDDGGQGQQRSPPLTMSHNHQEDPGRHNQDDDPVTSFLPAPLSAPPQRKDQARRTKRLAECF